MSLALGPRLGHEDVVRFHTRLGLEVEPPSKGALARLVARVLERLPFQNLAMLVRPRRAPTLAEIRADMIEGRGGPCGHMNPFLAALVHELGYAVRLVAGTMRAPDCHIALLVDLEGERLWVDIGNAFPYLEPIALGDEHARVHPLLDHRLLGLGGDRWVVEHHRHRGACDGASTWEHNYEFTTTPRSFESFAATIDEHYMRPGYGPFLLGLRATRFPPGGAIVLRDRALRLVDAERDESRSLDAAGLAEALSLYFADASLASLLPGALAALESRA